MAIIGTLFMLVFVVFVATALTGQVFYVVKQQHAVIIERLGRFSRIVGAGFHAKIPFILTLTSKPRTTSPSGSRCLPSIT